jgi:taurine dioxygenase
MKINKISKIGVEITDCGLNDFSTADYLAIRDLYFKENIVIIRQSDLNLLNFAKICASIGSIANEPFNPFKFSGTEDEIPKQRVTGILKNGEPTGIFGRGRLDWHCNMNGPKRAQCVGLLAVSGVDGSVTSWMSTIPAIEDMPIELFNRIKNLTGHFQYSPDSWAPGMDDFQRIGMNKVAETDGPYTMPLLQKTPGGHTGLYFHFLNSMTIPEDPEVFSILKDYLFQEKFIYNHHWLPGDIVLSNQVISLHKRQTDNVSQRLLYRYTFHHTGGVKFD